MKMKDKYTLNVDPIDGSFFILDRGKPIVSFGPTPTGPLPEEDLKYYVIHFFAEAMVDSLNIAYQEGRNDR